METTLRQATFQPDIIAAISRPAERTLTWGQYRALFLKPDRIEAGLAFYAAHRQTVDAVAEAYGVSWPYVLAILGIETRYGKFFGRWRVLDALTTLGLAYPPRQAFFARQLRVFLQQMHAEGLDPADRYGSYAGAMGYGQFIPSSYRDFAVDFDGDGRRRSMGRGRRLGQHRELSGSASLDSGSRSGARPSVRSRGGQGPARNGAGPQHDGRGPSGLGRGGLSGARGVYSRSAVGDGGRRGVEWIAGLPNLYVITSL